MNNLMVIDGIEVRRDAYGRYSLNDLHRAAVASGANARTKEPGKFLSSQQTVELVHELTNTQNLGVDPVSVIHGGNERGTYVCKELVYAYAMWISPSFHLKVIRTFDMVTSTPEKLSGQAADKMQAGVILLDFMRRELNLSNSSVLGACQKLQEAVGLPNLAPRYAIDAPADAPDGSSRPTLSLSALLKQYGTRAWTYRHWMGTGTVGVMIASSDLINPIPEESTETAARQHIGPLAPVAGSDLYVFRPVAHTVDFHIRVTPDTPEIRAAITAELRSFLLRDGYPQGELKVSRISEAISGANGEYSHQLLAPADNISIAKNELAVLGTISWT
ncbi:hypothetical protein H9J63_001675 [Escherichia coli]|nr:hypothetical protein [Escherichia coli]